jgi:hypothetical protein
MTRSVNGERLFDDTAREVLRRQLWLLADFCGVKIVTYAILANHFHVLVRVPERVAIADAELVRRYLLLHPSPSGHQAARIAIIVAQLANDGPVAVEWRRRMLVLMGDVSQYMKLLKQRFSIWFNRTHGRFGTLWAERFKSVLVEGDGNILQTIAAYIDLNCVRAGLVDDPKDYRFCGYAEAVAGSEAAQDGIKSAFGGDRWVEIQVLFGSGSAPREKEAGIAIDAFRRVIHAGGRLPLADALRCRIRYFTDGAVLGSRGFVEEQLAAYRKKTGRREKGGPRMLPALSNWGELATLRNVRQPALG